MIKIAYLNADDSAGFECYRDQIEEHVLKHPNREIYSLEDFVTAFNDEWISDLGYIVLVRE